MPSSASSLSYRIYVGIVLPTQLCAPNTDRDAVVINNESGNLYVRLGQNVSLESYTYRLTPHTVLEIPSYIGVISAIKENSPSYVQVTEIV